MNSITSRNTEIFLPSEYNPGNHFKQKSVLHQMFKCMFLFNKNRRIITDDCIQTEANLFLLVVKLQCNSYMVQYPDGHTLIHLNFDVSFLFL